MWHDLVIYYNCEKESELKNGNFGHENIALFLIQGSLSLFPLCVKKAKLNEKRIFNYNTKVKVLN